MSFEELPELLTIKEVTHILNVHANTLRNWEKEGLIKVIRIGPRKDRRYDKHLIKNIARTIVLFLAMTGLIFYGQTTKAATGAPNIISYQGRLTDSTGALLGGSGTSYNFRFSIWNNPTPPAGSQLWPAGSPGSVTLNVIQGVFNANIGDTANGFPDALNYDFNTNDTVYLQVEVFNTGTSLWETLSPRQQITSSGYAINANTIAGHTPGTGADNILLLDGSGNIGIAGAIDIGGTLQAGSSNVNLTLATGFLDADALGLISSDGAGGTSSGSGLETDTDRLGLLQGCANNQLLKWNDGSSVWACANDVSSGGSGTLQDAYDNGATILTADAKDLTVTLANTTTDSNFVITIADGSTSTVSITRADGAGTSDPAQLLLLDNADTNRAVAAGLKITSSGFNNGVTTALDVSASNIATGLALGSNDVTVGGATISSAEFALLDGRSGTLIDTANIASNATTAVTAGSGLTGGGTVGGLTLNIGSSGTITVNADDIAVTADSIGDTQLVFNTGQNLTTASAPSFAGLTLTSDLTLNAQSDLRLADSDSSNWVAFQSPATVSSNVTWTLPSADTSGCFKSNGSGTVSIASCTTGAIAGLTLAGTSGSNQTITDGDTITIAAGAGITTTGGATDTVTVAIDSTVATLTGSQTLTNKTLTAPKFADLGFIADASSNELLIFDSNASAVNQLTISNSATGNGLTLKSTGDDTDVALSIDAQAAGVLNLGNNSTGNILLGGGSASTGCTVTNSNGNFACTGTGTFSNFSGTNTGDQNIFQTIATTSGTNPVADSTTDTLTITAGTGVSVTGDSSTDTVTIANTGVTSLAGTANQITASASTGAVTLSLPSDLRAPGTFNAVTSIATGAGAGTVRIDSSGNLTSIGTITSGLINSQTISSSANFTGTVAFATLGSTDTTTILCRNSSSQLAGCNALTDSQISDTLTASVLTANYVANASTSALTGLAGGTAGSNAASLSLSLDESQALTGDVALTADREVFGASGLVFEGATANTIETFLVVTDPTATDKTITFPNATGTVAVSGSGGISVSALGDITCSTCVLTSGSYADPSWITSLAWSKITGTPTDLAGYGITDALSNSATSTQDGHFGDIYLKDDVTPSHYLQITDNENLTGAHSLSLSVGNADRTLTLSGNPTIADWFDQSVKTTASPTFANITDSGLVGAGTRCVQTDALGVISPAASACGSGSGTITIGTTTITSGTDGRVLYDNAGVVGEMTTTGSGTVLVLATSPTLVTPVLGVASGTSLTTSAQDIFSATAGTAPLVIRSATSTDDDIRLLPQAGGAARFAGIITTADLTAADKTYTFPNATGTVITTGNITDITGLTDSQISDTLTASIFKGSGTTTDAVDLATAEVAGTLAVGNGGTGAISLTGLLIGNGASAITATTVSSGISGQLSDETGSGALVFGTSPTITTSLLFANGQGIYDAAANILDVRNGTNGQLIRNYNTFTDASNYERFETGWSGNVYYMGMKSAGTGIARTNVVYFDNTSTTALQWAGSTTPIVIGAQNSSTTSGYSKVTIGNGGQLSATAGTMTDLTLLSTVNPTSTSTQVWRGLAITPTINYSAGTPGAGSYEALKIAVTETALPTGTNYLIRASAGAAGTTDEFTVGNTGNLFTNGTINLGALGTTDSTSILCRNTSNILAACNALTDSQISDTLTASVLTANYVANASTSALTGLAGGTAGSNAASLSLSLDESQALTGDVALTADREVFGASGLVFEGATANTIETFLVVTDPTATDKTITFPNATGTVAVSGSGGISVSALGDITCSTCVLTSGSYADPSWITSLAWSKITGTPTDLAGYGITDALSNSATSTQDGHFGDIYLKDDVTPSHYLQITDAENLTGAHSLSLSVGNADRTLTLSGNPTIADWFDQSVKTTASPTFANITDTGLATFGTRCLQTDNAGVIAVASGTCGTSSGISSLTLAGTSGSNQSISDGDTILIAAGNGISTTGGATDKVTVALSALTGDWDQTGAFNISLNNSSAGLKMLENGSTPTLFGIFDVADLTSADKTYTFPNATGTVITTGNITDITGLTDSQISDTLTASVLTANYVANASTSALTGLAGGTAGSNAASLSLSLDESQALSGDVALLADREVFGASGLVFEGATANTIETYLVVTDPTASDKTITFPNATGTVAVSGSGAIAVSALGDITCSTCVVTGGTLFTAAGTSGSNQTISQGDTLTIAAGTGITTTGGATDTVTVAVNQATNFAWTGLQTHTNTITDDGSQSIFNLTLGDDGNVDTVSGIKIAATSAATGDADVLYGLDIANLTDADTDVLERAIHIGSGWDNVIDDNGVLISATELNVLDGGIDLSGTDVTGTLAAARFGALTGDVTSVGGTYATTVARINGATLGSTTATDKNILIADGSSWVTRALSGDATISNTGTLTIAANAVALATDTTGNYVATVADAGNSTITVSGSGSENAAITLDVVDLNCTNCIGPTEITDLTLGTDTAGNYVAAVTTSVLTGLTGGNVAAEGTTSALAFDYSQALSGDVGLVTKAGVFGQNGFVFEGTTADAIETFISITDPTATDKTITIPDRSGTVSLSGDTFTSDVTGTLDSSGATALTIAANAVALGTDTTNNYVADLTAGTAIDVSGGGGETATITVDLDSTEIEATTFGAGGNASNAWTFNLSGTDPILTAISGGFQINDLLQLGHAGTDGSLKIYSEDGGTDHSTIFNPGVQTQDIVYTLPVDDGGVNQVLQTDGDGILSWVTPSAGSGDITAVGDCAIGACFTGTSGTTLTFDNGGGDKTLAFDGSAFTFNDDLISSTLDTGQGANELYDMDQNVLTTSSPTFANITDTGLAGFGTRCLQTDNAGLIAVAAAACGSGGSGDSIQINGSDVTTTGNFTDVANTGTVTGTAWTLTPGSPDAITLNISNADGTHAGSVTTGSQTFAGAKTFTSGLIISGAATDITTGTDEDLTVVANGAGVIVLNDAVTLNGNLSLANQATDILIKDNTSSSFTIKQGANTYLDISTNDNTESFSLNLPTGGGTSQTANLFTSNIAKTINLGTGTAADTIHIGEGGTTANTITVGSDAVANTITIGSASSTGVSITDNNWSINTSGVANFITGSVIGSQTFTTNNIADSGGLNIATGANGALTLAPNGSGDLVFNPDADTNLQITATGVPAVDMIAVTNSGQVITTDGVDGLSIDFRQGNGSNVTNSGINLAIVAAGDSGDTLNGFNLSSVTTSSGEVTNGINIAGTTSNGTDTGIKIGAGWDTGLAISQNTNGGGISVTATGVPTADQVVITNSGQAITTAGIEGLSITYAGGAAAVESSGERIDLTPGTTAAGTWSGLRFVANATGPADQVIENGAKFEGPTSISNGGLANAVEIKNAKWTTALNVEEASSGIVLNSPFGGIGRYENYVSRSEEFSNSSWTKEDQGGGAGVTVTADNTTAPDGTTTAEKLADNATVGTQLYQSATAGNTETWTFSVWVKNNDATTDFKLKLRDNSITGTASTNTITIASPSTDNWQRYSVTRTTAGASVTAIVADIDVDQGDSTRSIYIWGAQLEKQTSPGVYVKTIGSALAFQGSNGLVVDGNLNNATASGFIYGTRFIDKVVSGTAGTHDGVFIRTQDDTSLTGSTHVVRGLEVQAWNGSNTNGTNIGIDAYGKTFGLSGTTDALSGAQSSPAAVFAYLKNGTGAEATGNAIRAYSDKATTATLVNIFQETSTFTGNGLVMDLGNSCSSCYTSGNFISLKNAGTQKSHIDFGGNVFGSLAANTGTWGICHAADGAQTDIKFTDCNGAPGDTAEWYAARASVNPGDIVSLTQETFQYDSKGADPLTGDATDLGSRSIGVLDKTNATDSVFGVISTGPWQTFGQDIKDSISQSGRTDIKPVPVALSGRVPVNLSDENGAVVPGDYLTPSITIPGFAMKAAGSGWVIGQVLTTPNQQGQALMFVKNFYYDPAFAADANGNVTVQRTGTTGFETTSNSVAMLIDQKGSGDLLQVQNNGNDKLLVKNNGELNINVTSADVADNLVVVKSNDSEVFSINARGQVAVTGNIVIKDDTFAGSIATDANGEAQITFTYDLGSGKPDVQLTVESDTPAFAQINGWDKDMDGNYTGFKIKTFMPTGGAASVVVHYLVTGKQSDYQTSGTLIEVVTAPAPAPSPSPDPAPAPSPEPTPTPSPDPIPVVDPTVSPDPIPVVDPVPAPEPTPDPSPTPTPDPITLVAP